MNYFLLLRDASKLCLEHNKEDSVTKILLMYVTKMDSTELLTNFDSEISREHEKEFWRLLNMYIFDNIPVQHLTNEEYFYGRKFHINEDVLIPRFETEELVSNVLMIYDEVFQDNVVDVVDVGTGSGAIAISLDLEEKNMNVDATDISEDALIVAKKNNIDLGAKVTFYQGDMLAPLTKKYDILVSNPPYIPKEEFVDSLVKDNEPHLALFGGDDGLYFYRQIISGAKRVLKDKSIVAFEHAYDKKDELAIIVREYFPKAEIRHIQDMQGKDRMTVVINR